MAPLVMHSSKVKKSKKAKKTSRSKKRAEVKDSAGEKKDKNSAVPTTNKIFPFFELPRELRDMTYEYVALSSPTILPRSTRKRDLLNACPLMSASHQLREEFSSILTTHSTPIGTTVLDFNFSHVVRFLNTLSERELSMLPSLQAPSNREFIITLDGTLKPTGDIDMMGRWLRRCEHPMKKGTNIDIRYALPRRLSRLPRTPTARRLNHLWSNMGQAPASTDESLASRIKSKIIVQAQQLQPRRAMHELKKMMAAEPETWL